MAFFATSGSFSKNSFSSMMQVPSIKPPSPYDLMANGMCNASFIWRSSAISASTSSSVVFPVRPINLAISAYRSAASVFFALYLITFGRYIAFAAP